MSKMVLLKAATDAQGSECETEMCTLEEWKELTDEEKEDFIGSFQQNVVNLCVTTEDGECVY